MKKEPRPSSSSSPLSRRKTSCSSWELLNDHKRIGSIRFRRITESIINEISEPKSPMRRIIKTDAINDVNHSNLNQGGNDLRLEHPKRWLIAFYSILLLIFTASYFYNLHDGIVQKRSLLFDYAYLTHWNLTFLILFVFIELICNLLASIDQMTSAIRNHYYHSIVLPFSMVSSCLFSKFSIFSLFLLRIEF